MHPFAKEAKSGNRAKFKAITGKAGGGQVHSDEPQDRRLFKRMMAEHERGENEVSGAKSKSRADKYARGGRTKGKVNINIVIPQGDRSPSPPLPPLPLGPAAGIPPPGIGGPPPMPPGGPPMPMMKTGGRVAKARGGRFTGGAETGVGRLEKAAHLKGRRG